MTTVDNPQESDSPFLTESLLCPRQILEGDYPGLNDDEYARLLDYQHRTLMRYRFKQWHYAALTDDESEDHLCMLQKVCDFLEAKELTRVVPKTHAGHELGAREFTLTYSPKWFDDAEARVLMMKAIDKLCKYYADDIVELRAIGEVGSNGLSHIHCFYKLKGGRKITDKNFKRAWTHWNPKKKIGHGFEGGHHQTVKEESDFRGYIDKHVDTAWFEKNVANK